MIQSVEVDPMFSGASLDILTLWNTLIGIDKTISKAKRTDSRRTGVCRDPIFLVVRKIDGTENKNVSDTFRRTMFADYFRRFI